MSERYDYDFEAGDFSEFDFDSTGGSVLTVSAVSPISGTYSMNIGWISSGQSVSSSLSSLASLGDTFRVGMKVRLNSINFGTLQTVQNFFTIGGSTDLCRMTIEKSGSDIFPKITDTGGNSVTGTTDISSGEFTLELRCVRESGLGIGDGIFEIFVNGTSEDIDSSLFNFNNFGIAKVSIGNYQFYRLRIVSGTGHAGTITVDDVIFRDDDTQIYPPPITTGPHVWIYKTEDGGITWTPSRVKTTEFGYFTGEI